MIVICQGCGRGTDACWCPDEPVADPAELVRWAETYGHPEEWAKKAQQLHADNEKLREAILRVDEFLARYDAHLSPDGSTEVTRLRALIDHALGHKLIR